MFGDYDQNKYLERGDGMSGPSLGSEPTTRLEIAIDKLCDTIVTERLNGNITEKQAIKLIKTLEPKKSRIKKK